MKIVILWNNNEKLLSETMEQLITESQCYLFIVICGGQNNNGVKVSASYKWAIKNGAPIEYLIEPIEYLIESDIEKLIEKIVKTADFLVAYNDGTNQIVKRLIMKFKNEGKHGRIINAY